MSDKWDQIEEIVLAAVKRNPSDRAPFLDQACGGDRLLREEVESLLENDQRPVSIFDRPLFELTGHVELEGTTVDHYRIISWIGSGGMGDVYLAEDQRLGRKVALKMLAPFIAQDASHIRHIQKEARATAALNHPNIITIYDIGHTGELPYIAMEFIEGQTLRARMKMSLSIHESINICIQVASGLLAAHRAGILHRDIKPENIMLGVDGDVKILDFGIAQLKDPNSPLVDSRFLTPGSSRATQSSVVAGTPGYASPEQVSGLLLDARTDIFSLGVLLFEMTTGHRPFDVESFDGLQKASEEKASTVPAFQPNVPADLARIIIKSIEKDRNNRYESITEMLKELREFSRDSGEEMDSTQRANQMFRQYLSIYAVDRHALIPLTKLYAVTRYSDVERGERGKELIKKSLRSGLIKAGTLVLLIFLATTVIAAMLSVNETWDETILKDGHSRAVRQVAFSPDGKLLVSVGEDAKVIVWDFERRMPLKVFTDHTKLVTSVAFSPDGKWFATGSEDNSVIVWDALRLEKAAVLPKAPGIIISVAFSHNGRMLASASHETEDNQGHITLWSVGNWTRLRELPTRLSNYGRLLFSSDDQQVLSTAGEIWNVAGRKVLAGEFLGINWIAPSPDGSHMITLTGNGNVSVVDVKDHEITMYPAVHQDSGRGADFSPDGRLAATGADDILLWDAASMTKLARFEASSVVWNVAFSPDGRWLVSTHGDSSILVWDVKDRKLAASLNGHSGAVRGVAFSPDGRFIASASEDRSAIVWDVESDRKVAVFRGPATRLTGVAFSPDGKRLATSEFGTMISTWNLADGKPGLTINSGEYCVAISPDNKFVGTTWGVYDSGDGHQIVDFRAAFRDAFNGSGQMYSLSFSHDGRLLAGAAPQHFIVLFDTSTWKLRDWIKLPDATFIGISFSPDGKHLVTGEDEGALRLWSIDPLRQIAVLGRHASRIKSVAYSPDGKQVASAGDDNTIRVWDVNGAGLIREIGTHTKPVLSVAYSPDGKRIVSGEHDYSVRLYTRHHYLWGYRLD